MQNLRCCLFYIVVLLFYGCRNFPADPERTLESLKDGTLKVGVMVNPPFTGKTESGYKGIEADMISAFAKANNANIQWVEASEEELFTSLEKFELAIVIGGLTSKSPRKKQSGFTQPYLEKNGEKHVIATPPGENALTLELEKFIHKYQANRK